MSLSPILDKMVNEFKDYAFKDHVTEDARNQIIQLYNMKENCKNDRPGKDGKVPTVTDITDHIYYLRWENILPF